MSTDLKPKKSMWRKLGIASAVVLLLLAGLWFVATSSGFLKAVVLPRVSRAAGADISVQDAELKPLSYVSLAGLKVQTTTGEPLLTARRVTVHYSLLDILRGRMSVKEIVLEEPNLRLVFDASGGSNLDPFLKRPRGAGASEAKPAGPPQVDVGRLVVSNATVVYARTAFGGDSSATRLEGLNLVIEGIKNGQTARFSLDSGVKVASVTAGQPAELTAAIKTAFTSSLGADLMPEQVSGRGELAVAQAIGSYADAAQLNAKLSAELSKNDIRQLVVNFSKGNTGLGTISVGGPLDLSKQEGKLRIVVTNVGPEVLSLAGGRFGMGFGKGRVGGNATVELKDNSRVIALDTSLGGEQFTLTRSNLSTPVLGFTVACRLSADLAKSNAIVNALSFSALQDGRPLLVAALSKEMNLDWNKGTEALGQSSFEMSLSGLDLADWKAFAGTNILGGIVHSKIKAEVQKAGRLLDLDCSATLAKLDFRMGSNRLDRMEVELGARARIDDFAKITLTDQTLRIARDGQTWMTNRSQGNLDVARQEANLQTILTIALPPVAAMLGRDDLSVTGGTLSYEGRVIQKNETPGRTNNPVLAWSAAGTVRLSELTGRYQSNRIDRLDAVAAIDGGFKGGVASVDLKTQLRQASQPAGKFNLTVKHLLRLTNTTATLTVEDLNQTLLGHVLAWPLGSNVLNSVSLSGALEGYYNGAGGAGGVTGAVAVTDLRMTDPGGKLPKVPLTAEATLDVSVTPKGLVEARQFAARLQQGNKAGGVIDLSGKYDLSNRASQVAFKIEGLNQNVLAPLLDPSMPDRKLDSVSIGAEGAASVDPQGDLSAKMALRMSDLKLRDGAGPATQKPLVVELGLDASLRKQVLDLRQLRVGLAKTGRAQNELRVSGSVDMRVTNAVTGTVEMVADALDLDPYLDLFARKEASRTNSGTGTGETKSAATTNLAPKTVDFGLKDFVVKANIARLYAREADIASLDARVRLDGGKVEVDPLKLKLNGAPAAGRVLLNLGVPDYQYDVSFQADGVPVAPLARSFLQQSQIQPNGELSVNLLAKGSGIADAALKQNLAARFTLHLTNANFPVVQLDESTLPSWARPLVAPVQVVKVVVKVFDTFTGVGLGKKLEMPDVAGAPLQAAAVDIAAANGTINLQELQARTTAMRVNSSGTITMAEVLTNSTLNAIPVQVALIKPAAQRLRIQGANEAPDGSYVPLPDFMQVGGTLGQYRVIRNDGVIGGIVANAVGGAVNDVVNAFSEAFGKNARTNAPATNSVGGGGDILQNLFGQPRPRTSAPATNSVEEGGDIPQKVPGQPRPRTNAPAGKRIRR